MPGPTKQAPPPLQVDTARVVLVGIGLWAVALVVLLLLGDRVDRMWTWTCVAAIALGRARPVASCGCRASCPAASDVLERPPSRGPP